jgi:hypothetical protein
MISSSTLPTRAKISIVPGGATEEASDVLRQAFFSTLAMFWISPLQTTDRKGLQETKQLKKSAKIQTRRRECVI